jgi:hypothetical protein
MHRRRRIITTVSLLILLCMGSSRTQAAGCEDMIAKHMIGEALLAAHFVAAAEQSGMQPNEINAILKNVA